MKKLLCVLVLGTMLFFSTSVLAEKTVLQTYFQEDSPPRYFETDNVNTGVCIDVINELNARLESTGISIVNPEEAKAPIARIMHYLEQSTIIDLFVGSAKTAKRVDAGIQFSVPLYQLNGAFARKRDNPFVYIDTSSLKGQTVGVLRASRSVQTMNAIEGVTVEETNTMEQNLKKLAVDRVDLVYYHDMGLAWQIKSYKMEDKLVLVDQSEYIESAPHYILFSEDVSQDVIAEINKAIEAMQADGTLDQILDSYK